MGQYYNAVVKFDDKKEIYYHKVDGEYEGAKLMEHSYWNNPFVLAIASKFWRNKGQLAWVGDYAEPDDFNWNDEFENAHSDLAKTNLKYNGFRLEGKYFFNHTKKQFIDLDDYNAELTKRDIEWKINPVSLATAVGNDKGGGDFHSGIGYEKIGVWAWDVIEITDETPYTYHWDYVAKKYETELKPEFSDWVDVTNEMLFIEGR